jgi:hypothetical protein
MKWSLSITVVAIAAAAVAVPWTPAGSAQQPGGRTVTLFESGRGGRFRLVDHPPRSPVANPESPRARFSLGDQGYWTGLILNRRGGRRIGRVYGAETVVSGSRFPKVVNVVHAIFRLDDGQIVVEAVVDERHPERIRGAVLGGTGAYEGARGTFTTKPGAHGNADTIALLP